MDRAYQIEAASKIHALWGEGKSACLIGPTGCGKTRMAWMAIRDAKRALWVTHRMDLRTQAVRELRKMFDVAAGRQGAGRDEVAAMMPGRKKRLREARVTVASVQTLLEPTSIDRLEGAPFSHLVIDECHHYRAAEWQRVREKFGRGARRMGMTAYPLRRDGKILRMMFDAPVATPSYGALVAQKVLVSCRVFRPKVPVGKDLAQEPVAAWLAHSERSKSFVFVPSIRGAYGVEDTVNAFRQAGIHARPVTAHDDEDERQAAFNSFRDPNGAMALVSVDALIEGIDEPQARCVVLARRFLSEGGYVQAVGRVMRGHPGKRDAIVLDLVGATELHGLPDEDRDFEEAYLDAVEASDDEQAPDDGEGDAAEADAGDGSHEPGPGRHEPEVLGVPLVMVTRGGLEPDEEPMPVAREEPLPPIMTREQLYRRPRIRRGMSGAQILRASLGMPPEETR